MVVKCPTPKCGADMPVLQSEGQLQVHTGDFASVIVLPNPRFKCPRCFTDYTAQIQKVDPTVMFQPAAVTFSLQAIRPKNGILLPPTAEQKVIITG